MNFGMPRTLDFAVERKRPNFTERPLCANEPLRYTHFLPTITTEILTRGIKKFFPPSWSLIPLPPLIRPPTGDPSEAAYFVELNARETRAKRYDYYYPSASQASFDMLTEKLGAHTDNLAIIAAGGISNGAPRFLKSDQSLMDTCLNITHAETKSDEKETTIIGVFLIALKSLVSLSLGQIIDNAAKSDRPGHDRRPNFILRTFLELLEPLCRGSAKNYNSVLQETFNSIGKAESIEQATFVMDQIDYFRNIFFSYIELHPGSIVQIPTDEDYLNAIFYRIKDHGKLHDLFKLLKQVLESDNIVYESTLMKLRLALQSNKPNIFDSSTLPSYSESSEKASSNYSSIQTSHSSYDTSNTSHTNDNYHKFLTSYYSLPHSQVMAFHAQQQALLGYGGPPVPTPLPSATPPFPGNPAWNVGRPATNSRCNAYPLCSWRNGNCRFAHTDIHGLKNPILEQIQADAKASQDAYTPVSGLPWKPSQDLIRRTITALSSNPNDALSMTDMAYKKAKFDK
jgi:hypothetical protein